MIYLVNYSDKEMYLSQLRCSESALRWGVDKVFNYSPKSIDDNFYFTNRDILTQPRGAGYWLWKPYCIMKAFNYPYIQDGDIIIYTDAGVEFINSVKHIIDRMDRDVFLFGNNYNHVDWCKGDVLQSIIPYWRNEVHRLMRQVQASVIFFRVSKESKDFIREWLAYCQIPRFIDDSPSETPSYPTFAEHRHDQAILTCLQIKYDYKLHYWPATYNDGANNYEKISQYSSDKYPIIFHHHRKRNNEW